MGLFFVLGGVNGFDPNWRIDPRLNWAHGEVQM